MQAALVTLSTNEMRSYDQSADAVTSWPATFDAKWGQFVITPDFLTRLVYQGV